MKKWILLLWLLCIPLLGFAAKDDEMSAQFDAQLKAMEQQLQAQQQQLEHNLQEQQSRLEEMEKKLQEKQELLDQFEFDPNSADFKEKMEQVRDMLGAIKDIGQEFKFYTPGDMPGATFRGKGSFSPFGQKDWEVRFHSLDPDSEPFISLLESVLPYGSKVNMNPDAGLVAIYTSPEGHEKAEKFMEELKEKKEAQVIRSRSSSRTQRYLGDLPALASSVRLEILLLQGMDEKQESDEPDFSREALSMGLTPEDLKFLDRSYWRTYGKGFVYVQSGGKFETGIGLCNVEGLIPEMSANDVKLMMSLRFAQAPSPVRTDARIELGKPTLMISSNVEGREGSIVVAVRANLDKEEQVVSKGLDTIVPKMSVRNIDIREVLILLSKYSGLNFTTTKEVKGLVTVELTDMSIRDILDVVLGNNGFRYRLTPSNIVRVMTAAQYDAEESPISKGLDTVISSFSVVDMDLREVLDMLSQRSGRNFTISKEVKGYVTTAIENKTVREILDKILRNNGYNYIEASGGVVRVMTQKQFESIIK